MSWWDQTKNIAGQGLQAMFLGPSTIGHAAWNASHADWSDPHNASAHLLDGAGPFGMFGNFLQHAVGGGDNLPAAAGSPFALPQAIANAGLSSAAGALDYANQLKQFQNQQPAVDPVDRALMALVSAKVPKQGQSEKIINKYLRESLSPYDSAITGVKSDLADSLANNHSLAANLGRDLAVAGKSAKAVQAQMTREHEKQLAAQEAEQARVDQYAQQQFGDTLGDATRGGLAQARADQAGADASSDLGGEADAAFADEAAQWAKMDAVEQAHALQKQANRQIAGLRSERGSKEAQIREALLQQQQKALQDYSGTQLKALGMLSDRQQQQQANIMDSLKALGGMTQMQNTPVYMDDKGNPTYSLTPTPYMAGNRQVTQPVPVTSPLAGILQQLLASQNPSLGAYFASQAGWQPVQHDWQTWKGFGG